MDFVSLLAVLFRPRATFERLVVRRPLAAPLLTGAVVFLVLAYVTLQITAGALASGAVAAPPGAAERLRAVGWIPVALAPVGMAAQWLGAGLLLWAAALVVGARISLRGSLVVAAYGSVPVVLGRAADVALAALRGGPPSGLPSAQELASLAALVPDAAGGGWPGAVAGHVNAFTVGTLALWSLGMRVFVGDSPGGGRGAGALAWSVATFVAVAATHFTREMSRGLVPG
jgi:hypothetical protein